MDPSNSLTASARLVRLEPADAVQAHVGMTGEQRRPFGERFLDPVLAEVPLAGVDQRIDLLGRAALADRDQLDLGGIALGEQGGAGDPVEDMLPSLCSAAHPPAL